MPAASKSTASLLNAEAQRSSTGSFRSPPSAWSSSCWCRMPSFAARPSAGHEHYRVGAGSALGAVRFCVRCSSPSFPACCCCSPSSACRSTSPARRRILLHGNEGAAAAGQRHRGLRTIRGRRQLRRRLRSLHRPHRHSVHGGQPRRGAHRRGHRALHPRRHARQADGHRRRPQRRAHRRAPGPRPPRSRWPAKPSSTAPWTAPPASASATRWPPSCITAINIVAGFLIGVFQLDIPFRDALKTYTVLTVGDGLVTMIPSLLVSVAGGMVVTRASSNATLVRRSRHPTALPPRGRCRSPAASCSPWACIPGTAQVFLSRHCRRASGLLAWRLPKPLKDNDGKVVEPAEPGALPAARKTRNPPSPTPRRPAQARRTLARSRLRARHPGRRAAGRTASGPRQRAAQHAGRANSASSFRPFTSPTTCASSRANM